MHACTRKPPLVGRSGTLKKSVQIINGIILHVCHTAHQYTWPSSSLSKYQTPEICGLYIIATCISISVAIMVKCNHLFTEFSN